MNRALAIKHQRAKVQRVQHHMATFVPNATVKPSHDEIAAMVAGYHTAREQRAAENALQAYYAAQQRKRLRAHWE